MDAVANNSESVGAGTEREGAESAEEGGTSVRSSTRETEKRRRRRVIATGEGEDRSVANATEGTGRMEEVAVA